MKPYLRNEHLLLRAAEPEDLEVMLALENEPEHWDVSNTTVPYSRYGLRRYLEETTYDIHADRELRLMMADPARPTETVGIISVTDISVRHLRGEVGLAVRKDCRRQGYGRVALELLCDYMFEQLLFEQLYAYVPTDNEASLVLFKQAGFEPCGLLKRWLKRHAGSCDVLLLQRLNVRTL